MPNYLLKTKTFIPPLNNQLVSRPHLIEKLNSGLQPGPRLILISAPAGFGKSTLAAEWISLTRTENYDFPAQKFGWFSLDNEDNDPVRFLTYFITCIQDTQIENLEETLNQVKAAQLSSPKAVLANLINQLASISEHLVLVLDDYHVITNSEIHEGLAYFLEHLPSNVRLALTTRADPPFPLARLRARGQMVELRSSDLRFDLEEAQNFLNRVMQLNLNPTDLQELENHTEGWITGLHLAALSMQGQVNKSSFIATFTGNNQYILDYLLEEVLHLQPETVQTFLLNTSVLDRLTWSLCDALFDLKLEEAGTGTSTISSRRILEQLEKDNLFIIPLDNEHHWYRYHHLFSDFLRSRLQSSKPDLVAILHQRAAQWLEQSDLVYDAIHHTLQSSKTGKVGYEDAVRLIEKTAPSALQRGEINLLQNWLTCLPEELINSRPRLGIYNAWLQVFAGPVTMLQTSIMRLAQLQKTTLSATETNEIQNHIQVLQLFAYLNKGNPLKANELSQQVISHLPEYETFLLGMAKLISNLGFEVTSEESIHSTQPVAESNPFGPATGTNRLVVQLSSITSAMRLKMKGHLHQAEQQLRLCLQIAESVRQTQSILPLMACIALSDVLCERNELDSAERYARKVLQHQHALDRPELVLDYYLTLARIHKARGDMDSAKSDYAQLRRHLGQFKAPWYDSLVEMNEIRLSLQQHDLETVENWAANHNLLSEHALAPSPQILQLLIFKKNTLARVYLALNKFAEAESIERELIAQGAGIGIMWVIETHMLLALALDGQGHTDEAESTLYKALIPAEQEGYVRIFLDEAEPLIALLKRVGTTTANNRIKKYIDTLLLFCLPSITNEPARRSHQPTILDPLSDREIEVLHLISAGFSNKLIAERLYLAESTVKSHIHHIYTKLGVESRTQAVVRAKELKLAT